MKKIVVLSGAGISAESGLSTFRDSGGLWEQYSIEEVASIEGWYRNPNLMLDFYNARRTQLASAKPNDAHKIIAELEKYFEVTVITQNVDDLHEKAGSHHIIHLHGELTKACSENQKKFVTDIGYRNIEYGQKAPDGTQLRPFIVWFGEEVPLLEKAIQEVNKATVVIVIGTSLNVYPAASLIYYAAPSIPVYVIDPKEIQPVSREVVFIKEKATSGMKLLQQLLLKDVN